MLITVAVTVCICANSWVYGSGEAKCQTPADMLGAEQSDCFTRDPLEVLPVPTSRDSIQAFPRASQDRDAKKMVTAGVRYYQDKPGRDPAPVPTIRDTIEAFPRASPDRDPEMITAGVRHYQDQPGRDPADVTTEDDTQNQRKERDRGASRLFRAALAALAALALSALALWRHFAAVRRFPPGPPPLPLIGNLHQLEIAYPYRSMIKWRREYGSVFTVWLPKPTVVVADWDALQRLMLGQNGEHSLNRPNSYVYGIFTEHKPEGDGIILCSGAKWRAQRRFALSAFKSFGMGGSRMEARINRHKDELLRRLAASAGGTGASAPVRSALLRAKAGYGSASAAAAAVPSSAATFFGAAAGGGNGGGGVLADVNEQLAFCFGNVIHDLVMGRCYAYNDPEFLRFKRYIDATLERVSSVPMMIIDCYPWTRFLFPLYHDYLRDGYALQRFFLDEIERHAAQLDVNATPTNFIDAYLQDMYHLEDHNLSKLTLTLDSGDLWTGGLETVVTTLTWAVLYLIHYPDAQANLQAELDTVLARRAFQMSDRQRLPYLRATIDELQRIVNVLPWHIPHATDTEIEVCGRRIPAGATVMPQFGAVHMDEAVFPDPETFRPERFLVAAESATAENNAGDKSRHQNGNLTALTRPVSAAAKWKYVPSEHLAPFGIGKRACLGEGLARMELQIVLAALVQNFHFESVVKGELPSLERLAGMTSKPRPFKCRIRRRHASLILSDNVDATNYFSRNEKLGNTTARKATTACKSVAE